MAKKSNQRKRQLTIPIAALGGGLVGVIAPFGESNFSRLQRGDITGAIDATVAAYTGYSVVAGNWEAGRLSQGLLPAIAGFAAHWIATKIGLNRALARAGIPFLRI